MTLSSSSQASQPQPADATDASAPTATPEKNLFTVIKGNPSELEIRAIALALEQLEQESRRSQTSSERNGWGDLTALSETLDKAGQRVFNPNAFRPASYR